MAAPAPQTTAHAYEVLSCLGVGGFASVYWVRDVNTRRCFAMKTVMLQEAWTLPVWLVREVELLRCLRHEHIAQAHHAIVSPKCVAIFLETFHVSLSDAMAAVAIAHHAHGARHDGGEEKSASERMANVPGSSDVSSSCSTCTVTFACDPCGDGAFVRVSRSEPAFGSAEITTHDPAWLELQNIAASLIRFVRDRVSEDLEAWLLSLHAQMVSALGYLHIAHGRVHADIKPTNVLLDLRTGHLKLIDFGMSKRLADPHTRHTMMPPTLNYAGPEFFSPDQTRKRKRKETKASAAPPAAEPCIPLHAVDTWSWMVTLTNLLLGFRFLYAEAFPPTAAAADGAPGPTSLCAWFESERPNWARQSRKHLLVQRWLGDFHAHFSRVRSYFSQSMSGTPVNGPEDDTAATGADGGASSAVPVDAQAQRYMLGAFGWLPANPLPDERESPEQRRAWLVRSASLCFRSLWRSALTADAATRPGALQLRTDSDSDSDSVTHQHDAADRPIDFACGHPAYLRAAWQSTEAEFRRMASAASLPDAGLLSASVEEPHHLLLLLQWSARLPHANRLTAPLLQQMGQLLTTLQHPEQEDRTNVPARHWPLLAAAWSSAPAAAAIEHVPWMELLQRVVETTTRPDVRTREVVWNPEHRRHEWRWSAPDIPLCLHLVSVLWVNPQVRVWRATPNLLWTLLALLAVAQQWLHVVRERRRRRSPRQQPAEVTASSGVLAWATDARGTGAAWLHRLQPSTAAPEAYREQLHASLPRMVGNWHRFFAREWKQLHIPQATRAFLEQHHVLPHVFSAHL
jgi:serine/threonine protein kinase